MNARSVAMLLCLLAWGCAAQSQDHQDSAEVNAEDDFKGCPEITAPFEPGLRAEGEHFALKLLSAMPVEPERHINDWTLELGSLDGSPPDAAAIERSQTFMPVHGHDGRVVPEISALEAPGQFRVERLSFTMRGPWEVRFWLRSPAQAEDYVVFHVCVAK